MFIDSSELSFEETPPDEFMKASVQYGDATISYSSLVLVHARCKGLTHGTSVYSPILKNLDIIMVGTRSP